MERHEHLPRTGPFMGAKHVGIAIAREAHAAGSDEPLRAARATRDAGAFRALVERHAAGDPDAQALLAELTDAAWERHKSVVMMFAKAALDELRRQ